MTYTIEGTTAATYTRSSGEYWTRRDRAESLWHRVESEIAEAAITKCGRRLEPLNARGRDLDWTFGKPKSRACSRCSSRTASVTP